MNNLQRHVDQSSTKGTAQFTSALWPPSLPFLSTSDSCFSACARDAACHACAFDPASFSCYSVAPADVPERVPLAGRADGGGWHLTSFEEGLQWEKDLTVRSTSTGYKEWRH